MKVSESTLISCGMKKDRRKSGRRTWTRKTHNWLGDDVILEYDPKTDIARVIIQEPMVTDGGQPVHIKDDLDFKDLSWEFYVKFENRNGLSDPSWDAVAAVHCRPAVAAIQESRRELEQKYAATHMEYSHMFGDDKDRFSSFCDDVRRFDEMFGEQCDKVDPSLHKYCVDVLAEARSNGCVIHFDDISNEFTPLLMKLMMDRGKTPSDVASDYLDAYMPSCQTFGENDSHDIISSKVHLIAHGCVRMPIALILLYYLEKSSTDPDKFILRIEKGRKLVQAYHRIARLPDGKFCTGYHIDAGDSVMELYDSLKADPDVVDVIGISVPRSIYNNASYWLAGLSLGYFNRADGDVYKGCVPGYPQMMFDESE